MKKHVEKNIRGQNVGGSEEKYNNFPVELKICEANINTSSSDEDDPYNILRGKRFPRNENTEIHVQEKFTLPQISLGLEAIPDINKIKEKSINKQRWKTVETSNYSYCLNENFVDSTTKEQRQSKPCSKFGTENKSEYNDLRDISSTAEGISENRNKQKSTDIHKLKQYRQSKIHWNEQLPKIENIGDGTNINVLIKKLITECRSLALDLVEVNSVSKMNNEIQVKGNRKNRSVWDWKPKKENTKIGSKLVVNNLKLPPKPSNFLRLFEQFCKANCADMKVIIDDTVFHCHKIVLQSYSKFFQTHIRGEGYKKDLMIDIPNSKVNKNIFMDVYIWMLNSPKHCRSNFTNYNILNLLMAAAYLKIDELEKHCWNYISDVVNFNEAAAFDLYWEARLSSYWPVMELMVTRIKNFFLILIQTDKFTKLTENELHLLLDSNFISVHSEIEVFFALILWLRKKNITDPWECSLFRLIRFSQMSPIQLVELQSMSELHYIIKQYPVSEMIENGLRVAIRREHARSAQLSFNDPEPQTRNWLRRTIIYKSFNDFIDSLVNKRNNMRKPHCELIRREILEALKITPLQLWTPIVKTCT